jgi:MFS family permease
LSRDVIKTLPDRRPLYSLLTASGISQVGNAMTIVAGPWFVLQTTGSAAKTGLVGAAFALGLLMPILGGPLVDRLGFRRGSVVADLVSGATVALIPGLHLAGVLAYWHIVVLVFILTSVNSQGDTARLALVPALARLADMPPKRANARDRAIIRLGSVVGPFIAGVLIAGIGAVNVLFVDAGTMYLTSYVVGAGVIYGTLAFSPPLVVAIVAAIAAGLAFGPVNPIFATVTQENTPPHLLGRVFGALTTIAQAAIPIGAVVTGVAVQQAGLIPTIVGMGAVYVVVTIGMFFNPALRGMDIRDEPVSEPTEARAAAQDAETALPSRRTNIH